MTHGNVVRVDIESSALEITALRLSDPAVLRECRHWSEGRRGEPVELDELAAADLTAFAVSALTIGASAMAAAAGVQQMYGIDSLVAEVEERVLRTTATAGERTAAVVQEAAKAMRLSSEQARKALVDAGDGARTAFASSVEAAHAALTAQLQELLGGEEPQLALRLQPVLADFASRLEERTIAQSTALIDRVTRQFDPAEPTSPMAQQMRMLTETQARHAAEAADQQRGVSDKLDALSTQLLAKRSAELALARTAAKGATYEEQTHALLAEIAAGLGDEYVETGNVVGLRSRSKKGDGLLAVPGVDARLVVEMTDSPRSVWSDYLKEAEENRGAQAALGLVRSAAQLPGGPILTLGPRRVVMVFDPETDDVHLLRCVVQLLRTAALAAAARVDDGQVSVADERIAAAMQTLERIGKIHKSAGSIKSSARVIEQEADTLLTELTRLLHQARTALAGVVEAVRDDVA